MSTLEQDIKRLPPQELVTLLWELQRRPEQTPPDPLPFIWFLRGGRGSGKTKTGSNHVFETAKKLPHTPENRIVRVGLVSATFTDVRITMIEGETGLRSIIPRDLELAWNRSLGELKIQLPGPPYREVHFFAYSAERPELLRGPQHHIVWVDEPAKFKDADKEPTNPDTTWSNLMMGLRLGPSPHVIVTGSPEPNKLVKYLANHPNCISHIMTTFDNEANLPQQTMEEYRRLPRTSRTARQELFAEILLDNPDSIFSNDLIDQDRKDPDPNSGLELRKVLGYDPSMSASEDSDEAGIILSAFTKDKEDGTHAYILEDHSGHLSTTDQVTIVTNLIIDQEIPELIVEQNQGAGFVINNLKTAFMAHQDVQTCDVRTIKRPRQSKAGAIKQWKYTITFKSKNRSPFSFMLYSIHAKMSKVLRAELVAINYEQHRVHHPTQGLPICHVRTCSASLEDQMVVWGEKSKNSPDRMDAAVYTLLHIFGADHALSSKKNATITTAANAPDMPSYDPRQDLSRPPLTLSRHSRAYNVDLMDEPGGKRR